ncbi:hypothetical protein PILCRDRAFT_484718 [Piloderma croceum F 1598]|uniref:K Homology domain-containing protein n=1 Tax=Piloderma croceum (strain F 1598) TaxID=765440 RepID=A0A0C3B798_PILCF|nr:hypothetical protein PILCRDRAFT_484718 [Piloderma croceum F 1598]
MLKLTVTQRVAQRLMVKRSNIINSTGLDHMNIRKPDEFDGHHVVILRGKRPDILNKAQRAIQEICREVQNEAQLELKIPIDQHGLFLGPKWSTWSELVVRCGGPEDPKLQQDIIQIDQSSEQVSLRGQPEVINALAKEIQATITKRMPDIYSMLISPRYHCGEFHRSISKIQYKTKTLILLPGDGRYDDFGDPVDKPKSGDSNSVVKIIGTLDAFMQARMDLESTIRDIKQTLRVLEIPLKYQQAIHERVRWKLREMDVRVSPSDPIEDQKPIRPPENGKDWQVISRYYIVGVCEWTLRAATKDLLDQAQTLIEKAYETTRRAKYIGFLLLPDSSKFGRIIGKGGETVQKLQHDTNTRIVVPKTTEADQTIQITGSAQDIEEAKERIKALVNNDPPSPIDRLFKPSSRMGSRQ